MMIHRAAAFAVCLVGCGRDAPSVDTGLPDDDVTPRTVRLLVGTVPGTFAFQDGDGPWAMTPPPSQGIIELQIASPRYAIARLCSISRTTRVFFFAASEDQPSLECGVVTPNRDAIAGRITSTLQTTHLLAHGSDVETFADVTAAFDYQFQTTGTADVVAIRQPDGDGPDVFAVERDVAVSGTVTRNLNFNQLPPPVRVAQPIPNDTGWVFDILIAGATIAFYDDLTPPFDHAALAMTNRRPTDRYDVGVSVDLDSGTVGFDQITQLPVAVTAPTTNLLNPLTVMAAAGLTRFTVNKVPGATAMFGFARTASGSASIAYSPAWFNSFTQDLAWGLPDLATVEGWPMGGLRGPIATATVQVLVETGTFPNDGYSANTYHRQFSAENVARPDRAARRAEAKAWLAARWERMGSLPRE